MKNIPIKFKLLTLVFSSIILIAAIVSIRSVTALHDVADTNIGKYKKDTYESKVSELKNYTSTVQDVLKYYYNLSKGKSDDEVNKLRKQAVAMVSTIRYAKSGYFWINDTKPTMIMHPMNPTLNGKDLSSIKDPNGVYLFVEMAKAAKDKGEGLVKYIWAKPGKKEPQPKYSYVIYFKPWDFVVGTGVYVDDIEEKISSMGEVSSDKISEAIISIVIFTLLAIAILTVILNIISTKTIINPIKVLQDGVVGFFKYLNKQTNDTRMIELDSKDELGQMAKIINENIIQTKEIIEQDEALIEEVKSVVREVEKGYLTSRVKGTTVNESLEELKTNLNEMLQVLESNIAKDINKVDAVLEKYSRLNFIDKINDESNLAQKINTLSTIINEMLKTNLDDGYTLQENSDILTSNVHQLSTSSNQQASSLEETAAALEEITSTMRNNTSNMTQMSQYADELSSSVEIGQNLAQQTTKAIDEINTEITSISEAITVIDQIAFQTNILSLNAAVEAATAGESGKGFAVVAGEVRNLASRSAEAAKEIKELVESATQKANGGKNISDEMIVGYEGLHNSIEKTISIINDVSGASKEQMQGIEQINNAIAELDQTTQKNAMIATQTNEISVQTNQMAQKIVLSVNEKEFIGKN